MQKDADAFRTISEVASDLSLPQHVLRFWETRFPQVRPLKRAGGRRYYRPADVALLRTIRHLLYEDGYTIKGVQRLLKEQGPKGLAAAIGAPPPGEPSSFEPPPFELSDTGNVRDANDARVPVPAAAESVPANGIPQAGESAAARRKSIEDVLTTLEDCKRLLDAVNRPPTQY